METEKNEKVVMLPTNEKAILFLIKDKLESYHLYILSDDEIKEGDNYFTILDGVFRGYRVYSKTDILPKNAKKIIYSTDKSLNLHQPSPEFIQKYVDDFNNQFDYWIPVSEHPDLKINNKSMKKQNIWNNINFDKPVKKKNMKKITKEEINNEFERIMQNINVENYDRDRYAIEKVFQAGIDFGQSKKNNIYKIYSELGFPIDTKRILELITKECDENNGIYDELDSLRNIKFTKVSFNQPNSSNREMTIVFSASENRGGNYKSTIKIDSHGRVRVDMFDTPWEGGGVESEMIEILMKYVTKSKFM
jgi:hypothetical protein